MKRQVKGSARPSMELNCMQNFEQSEIRKRFSCKFLSVLFFFGLTNSRTTKVAKSWCAFSTGELDTEFSPESRLGLWGTRTHTDGTGAWLLVMLFDVATTHEFIFLMNQPKTDFILSQEKKVKKNKKSNQKPNSFACDVTSNIKYCHNVGVD